MSLNVDFLRNVSLFNTVHGWRKRFNLNFQFFISHSVVAHLLKSSLIKKLVMSRGKYVTFYTKHIFIVGHTSSQRLKSLNYFLKVLDL